MLISGLRMNSARTATAAGKVPGNFSLLSLPQPKFLFLLFSGRFTSEAFTSSALQDPIYVATPSSQVAVKALQALTIMVVAVVAAAAAAAATCCAIAWRSIIDALP